MNKKNIQKSVNNIISMNMRPPNFISRIFSIWFRHYRVYTKNLISNGFPVFFEPIFFLAALGLGLGRHLPNFGADNYLKFLASALLVPPAMYTASYECSFGTFIRLQIDKVYDGMLSSPINYKDLLIGEILFAGTKGLFFTFCILIIFSIFGLVTYPFALLAPIGGFLTGLMFGALSILVTSFVNNINHFNFYFTGLLTPMFFFSGVIFPLSEFPLKFRWIAELIPLTHPVRLVRAVCMNKFSIYLLFDLLYIILFIIIIGFIAIRLMKRKLID